mmetsp:Transcript_67175/g.160242  ORF Transcript_67175/g.160242 Transcript_67175/m.160242 type:complete len:277 (+) Transcript_67175:31-861(+)
MHCLDRPGLGRKARVQQGCRRVLLRSWGHRRFECFERGAGRQVPGGLLQRVVHVQRLALVVDGGPLILILLLAALPRLGDARHRDGLAKRPVGQRLLQAVAPRDLEVTSHPLDEKVELLMREVPRRHRPDAEDVVPQRKRHHVRELIRVDFRELGVATLLREAYPLLARLGLGVHQLPVQRRVLHLVAQREILQPRDLHLGPALVEHRARVLRVEGEELLRVHPLLRVPVALQRGHQRRQRVGRQGLPHRVHLALPCPFAPKVAPCCSNTTERRPD